MKIKKKVKILGTRANGYRASALHKWRAKRKAEGWKNFTVFVDPARFEVLQGIWQALQAGKHIKVVEAEKTKYNVKSAPIQR
jgi:hypothetical protein